MKYKATDITGKIVEYFEADNMQAAQLWAVENFQKIPGFWYISESEA